jgi:hypothetical protein
MLSQGKKAVSMCTSSSEEVKIGRDNLVMAPLRQFVSDPIVSPKSPWLCPLLADNVQMLSVATLT